MVGFLRLTRYKKVTGQTLLCLHSIDLGGWDLGSEWGSPLAVLRCDRSDVEAQPRSPFQQALRDSQVELNVGQQVLFVLRFS